MCNGGEDGERGPWPSASPFVWDLGKNGVLLFWLNGRNRGSWGRDTGGVTPAAAGKTKWVGWEGLGHRELHGAARGWLEKASLEAVQAASKAGSDTGNEGFASYALLCIPCQGRKDFANSQ